MIITTVLTLGLLAGGTPTDLVEIVAPTRAVTLTLQPQAGCAAVSPWLIQCWADAAQQATISAAYQCDDVQAVVVVHVAGRVRLIELECNKWRWRQWLPWMPNNKDKS